MTKAPTKVERGGLLHFIDYHGKAAPKLPVEDVSDSLRDVSLGKRLYGECLDPCGLCRTGSTRWLEPAL